MTTRARKEALLTAQIGRLLAKTDQGKKSLDQYWNRRAAFAHDILGMNLWHKQVEILEAIDSAQYSQICVVAGNSVGKSFLIPVPALHNVFVRHSTVLITGPTGRSIKNILMRGEISKAFHRATDLEGDLTDFALKSPGGGRIIAFASKEVSKVQGIHDRYLLAIADEAQGIEPPVWDGIYACCTGDENIYLAFGNPLEIGTEFHAAAESPDWLTLKITVLEHPNIIERKDLIEGAITIRTLERWKSRLGEESDEYKSRVLAQFPSEDLERQLVAKEWLEASAKRWAAGGRTTGGSWDIGMDLARSGTNANVMCARNGRRVECFHEWNGADLMATCGRIIEILRDSYQIATITGGYGPGVLRTTGYRLICDVGGLGGGVVDRLTEQRYNVTEFDFGRGTENKRFQNKRAESYWHLANQLERGLIDIQFNKELWEELLAMTWTTPRSEGRKQLVAKHVIKQKLRRSPDKSDALVMTLATGMVGITSGLATMLDF